MDAIDSVGELGPTDTGATTPTGMRTGFGECKAPT